MFVVVDKYSIALLLRVLCSDSSGRFLLEIVDILGARGLSGSRPLRF